MAMKPISEAPRDGTWFEAVARSGVWRKCRFQTIDGVLGKIDGPWDENGISFTGATHFRELANVSKGETLCETRTENERR